MFSSIFISSAEHQQNSYINNCIKRIFTFFIIKKSLITTYIGAMKMKLIIKLYSICTVFHFYYGLVCSLISMMIIN